jgi:hypothetical protein
MIFNTMPKPRGMFATEANGLIKETKVNTIERMLK